MKRTIRIARRNKDMTQHQLCELVGIGMSTLVKLEKGNFKNLKYPTMLKLAEALNVPVQELFFSEDEDK